MAGAAMSVLRAAGRRIPDDVAVVGFDDRPWTTQTDPPLTAVHQPVRRMVEVAAGALLDHLDGVALLDHLDGVALLDHLDGVAPLGPDSIVLPTGFTVRESTTGPDTGSHNLEEDRTPPIW